MNYQRKVKDQQWCEDSENGASQNSQHSGDRCQGEVCAIPAKEGRQYQRDVERLRKADNGEEYQRRVTRGGEACEDRGEPIGKQLLRQRADQPYSTD